MSWRANMLLASSLCAVSAIFGGGIAIYSFWLVLPFALLEFLLLTYCLYRVYRKLGYTEVVYVQESTLIVESGYDKPESTVELPRHWTRIEFDNPVSVFEVGQLVLRSGGRSIELGRLLNKNEKKDLYDELQRCLGLKETKLRLIS